MHNTNEGRYANYFEIGHNEFEFVIECGQFFEKGGSAICHTRIITTPVSAQALLHTLQDAISQHNKRYNEGDKIVKYNQEELIN